MSQFLGVNHIMFKVKNTPKISLHRKCVKFENVIEEKKTDVVVQKLEWVKKKDKQTLKMKQKE